MANVLDMHIEELGLSVRCYRTLKHEGVFTLRDIGKATEDTLTLFYTELQVKGRKEAWAVLRRRKKGIRHEEY